MENKKLLEEIKRMHEIIGITPKILINEGVVQGVEKFLLRLFVSSEIKYAGKTFAKKEVRQILNKIGKKALSTEEKEVAKIATSKIIAKDADKAILKTIAAEFNLELKNITDNAVATANYQEFKALTKDVLTTADAAALDKELKAEMKNTVKPVIASNLGAEKLRELAKSINGSKLKNLQGVTDEYIATVHKQYPNLNTTQLIEKIIADAPERTFTYGNIKKVISDDLYGGSKTFVSDLADGVTGLARKAPWGKIIGGSMATLLVYIVYQTTKGVGEERGWTAFKKDIDKIRKAHPCLFDKQTKSPLFIAPGDGFYWITDDKGGKFPAVWDEKIGALYYVEDKDHLDAKTDVVQC
jgi:hypothetical protein